MLNHSASTKAHECASVESSAHLFPEISFELRDDMATREKLLYAAAAVFSDKDFYSTKLEDIAERAKLAKGTIYLYFKDKTDLIVSSIEYFDTMFLDHIKEKLVGVTSPMMRLKIALNLWLTVHSHCSTTTTGLHSFLHALPPDYRDRFIKLRREHIEFVRDLLNAIAERVGKGTLKRSTDMLAEVILDAMLGYISRVDAKEYMKDNPPEKYARFLVDVVLPHHEWLKEKI